MIIKAFQIAYNAHKGQFDKGGNPYILHPIMVALNVESDDEKIVALLHDVVEDTGTTLDDLWEAGFSDRIIEAVDVLTKKDSENYEDYLCRVKENELAKNVKIADLRHNSDVSRLKTVNEKDVARITKYLKALCYLLNA